MLKPSEQLNHKPLFSNKELLMIAVLFSIFVSLVSYIMELETELERIKSKQNTAPCSLNLKIDKTISKPLQER